MFRFILTGYIEQALTEAIYDKLEDGSFFGRIPMCKGVVAFGKSLRQCEEELRSTLEEWILLGLKMGHPLPVFSDYNLNLPQKHEPMVSV
jgi:predicted RNase H-like HicB family nuclease